MSAAPSEARRTFVVILGGSKFPYNPGLDIDRLATSALALKDYFLDPKGFGLPDDGSHLKWLFDEPVSSDDVKREIRDFLVNAYARPADEQPLDVIVVYVGHGILDDDKRYRIVTPTYDPQVSGSALLFRDLQQTVKNVALRVRRFYVLDARYSGAAAGDTQATDPITPRVVSEMEEEARDETPGYGTALLCAASRKAEAMAPRNEQYTMFSGALLSILRDSEIDAARLTLRGLHRLVRDAISKRFPVDAVRPEIHIPEQDQGDIGSVALFPVSRRSRTTDPSELVDVLVSPIAADDARLHAVVVGHQRRGAEPRSALQQAVFNAWFSSKSQIVAAVDRCRAASRAPLVPTGEAGGGFVLAELCLERACESERVLQQAVSALCRAEVAVFDLTDWDPVATFLLGVRAVVRRGVTITTRPKGNVTIPFNLQLLNMLELPAGDRKRASELIGSKIVNGFRELWALPHYLDLPAYDAVRQLGIDSSAYRPIDWSERVLVLCPFAPEYTEANWGQLETLLPPVIKERVEQIQKREVPAPILERLLNLKTPRLVAQTLFESIRLTDMCVIDWTGGNKNVIFEAGVRMALNPLGAVHVIEKSANDVVARSTAPGGLAGLLRLLKPTEYNLVDPTGFPGMTQRFEASVEASGRGETNFVYRTVGAAIDRRSQPAALPVVTELSRSANLLDTEDQEGGGVSPVLFHDVNADLAREAREAAADRRLASWLFMSRRYEPREIAEDSGLLDAFELLSFQVKRWARRSHRLKVRDEVQATLDAVRDAASSVAYRGSLDAEQEATRLITRAKRDKEEAKNLRDDANVAGAVALLKKTVAVLSESRLARGLEAVSEPTQLQKDLAAQLADCYGMLGGNYRRLDQPQDAYAQFLNGVPFEMSEPLAVMSSYNLVNSIVMSIETGKFASDDQHKNLQAAVDAIGRQVRSQRRNDRWAWADLAQCQLLLGDPRALESYTRVRTLGDDQTAGSIVPVLERLATAVPSRADAVKAAIATLRGGAAAAPPEARV